MSLHDVNKSNASRSQAMPNAADGIANRQAHSTSGIAYRDDAASGVAKVIIKDDLITIYDSAVPRILIGLLPDGTYGIVISKEDIDVTTAFS